jgi:hypothetical protein
VTSRANKRPGIFISYRTDDSRGHAGRLSDSLRAVLGDRARVFMDVETIQPGAEFANALDEAVTQCRVFYALIGPTWVDIRYDNGNRRLLDPKDYVRREIAMALSRSDEVRVVPVLVGGASLPHQDELPEDLQALVGRQGFPLHDGSWRQDVDNLVTKTLRPRSRLQRPFAIGAATLIAIAVIVGLLLTVTKPDSANRVRTTSPTTGVGVQNIATNRSAGDSTDNDPRAQIVKLTGAWSVQGFVDAIEQRNTDIVDKYLKSGMKATTLHSNASAVLYGFQGDMDNDPVALLKTFQGNGYKLDDELVDGRILHSISDSLPLRFETQLTPKNYTGGYADGEFAGPLLLWVVSRASWVGASGQDRAVLAYLISQHADCSVALSYLDFNHDVLSGTSPFDELYPMIKKCAK